MGIERTIESNGSVGDEFFIPCAKCDNNTKHEVVSSVDIKEDLDAGDIMEWTSYQIVQCRGCLTYSFRSRSANTEDFTIDPWTG